MPADPSMQTAVTIAGLVVKNRRLSIDVEESSSKRRRLEEENTLKDEALDSLSTQCFDNEADLLDVCAEKNLCLAKKTALEKDYKILDAESTSVIGDMVAAQAELEGKLNRKDRSLRSFSTKAMKLLKGLEDKAGCDSAWADGWEIMDELHSFDSMGLDGDVGEDDEGVAILIQKLAAQVHKIEDALMIRNSKMKNLKIADSDSIGLKIKDLKNKDFKMSDLKINDLKIKN